MSRSYDIGLKMTKTQTILGWLYLPFYLALTSWGLRQLAALLGLEITNFQLNIAYFAVNFVVVLAIFHRFLLKSLRGFTKQFWQFIQTLILGFALYYIATFLLMQLLGLLFGETPNLNSQTVAEHIAQHPTAMLVCTVVVAPIVEEVLLRGVVYGSIHRTNRIVAYIVSSLIFSIMHVWQYYQSLDVWAMVRSALQYVPAAIALGWTYEKSGTLWTPIVLHAVINAISYGITLQF